MAALRKNWLTTIGGIMTGLGTLPLLVTTSHVAFPLWWNNLQFPLVLLGLLGGVVLGIAAKGVDEHSTAEQITAATLKQDAPGVVDAVVKAADVTTTPVAVVSVTKLDGQ